MTSNTAHAILWPNSSDILVRTVILYVGQGASALVFVADNGGYKTILVDINLDRQNGGIDVPMLVRDVVGNRGLDVFINTHPHDDHLCGVKALSDSVTIREVWHSGHVPSRKYGSTYYDELVPVMTTVRRDGGLVTALKGSRSEIVMGDGRCHVLAPAQHVTDQVNEEEADLRYQRIHEQCAVLKFGGGASWSLFVGDADRAAFENHITSYHRDRLQACFLAGSHHGSRTFFCYDEADEPYRDGLDAIDPDYVVISAPRKDESKHGHPHDDAMQLYREKVGAGNVLHTGEFRHCYICDIYRDGSYGGVDDDGGVLADAYALKGPPDNGPRCDDRPRVAGIVPRDPACSFCKEPQVREVVLPVHVRSFIESETTASPDRETGGILIGYVEGGRAHIIEATGPGPGAVRSRTLFRRDVTHVQAALDRAAQDFGAKGLYVGEWHSHLSPDTRPSPMDVDSLVGISHAPHYLTRCPVMLIAGLQVASGQMEALSGFAFPLGGRCYSIPVSFEAGANA